jgi:integrase
MAALGCTEDSLSLPNNNSWRAAETLVGTLRIQRSIVRQRVGETKTEYSDRAMPIDAEMLDVLKTWKQVTQFRAADDWIFAAPAKIGRLPWSADSLNDAYEKAGKASGVGHVTTHTMRHTYRSWLGRRGYSASGPTEAHEARGHQNNDERLW